MAGCQELLRGRDPCEFHTYMGLSEFVAYHSPKLRSSMVAGSAHKPPPETTGRVYTCLAKVLLDLSPVYNRKPKRALEGSQPYGGSPSSRRGVVIVS